MHSYFISDLHLTPERPELTRAFFAFMRELAPTAERLYILGDLFEYWIGDDGSALIGADEILDVMAETSNNVECFFIPGNRDFLVREEFSRRTGFTILADETIIDLYGTPTLLLHGDSLCIDDFKHQEFRRTFMCNKWKCWWVLRTPLNYRLKRAQGARKQSKDRKTNMDDAIMDVTERAVVAAFEDAEVTQMIHGHTHRQAIHEHDTGQGLAKRFVLGDWHTTNSILTASVDGLTIDNQAIF